MNAMSEIEAAEPIGPKARLSLTSLYELFESTPEPAWLVDDVAIEAQPLIIGGAIKTLKTSVALDLAVSLATGTEFLGRFRVPKRRRVAFFSGEGARATVKETTERILRSKGKGVRAPEYACHFAFALPRIGRASDRAELRRILKGERIGAVIFDPLYLCMRADGSTAGAMSNLYEVGPILAATAEACADAGATPIFIHHTNKSAPSSRGTAPNKKFSDSMTPIPPVELADLALAGVGEFARQWILLGRSEEYEPGSGRHDMNVTLGGAGRSAQLRLAIDEGRKCRSWKVSTTPHGPLTPHGPFPTSVPSVSTSVV